MKNWKTTLGGVLTAVGVAMSQMKDEPVVNAIGLILTALGPLFVGLSAKDNNVVGGTKAQATPMGVREESIALGQEANLRAFKSE